MIGVPKKGGYYLNIIKHDLPSEFDEIELHIFADEHIGDPQCDFKRLMSRIAYIKDKPNAYCILNGDLIDRKSVV